MAGVSETPNSEAGHYRTGATTPGFSDGINAGHEAPSATQPHLDHDSGHNQRGADRAPFTPVRPSLGPTGASSPQGLNLELQLPLRDIPKTVNSVPAPTSIAPTQERVVVEVPMGNADDLSVSVSLRGEEVIIVSEATSLETPREDVFPLQVRSEPNVAAPTVKAGPKLKDAPTVNKGLEQFLTAEQREVASTEATIGQIKLTKEGKIDLPEDPTITAEIAQWRAREGVLDARQIADVTVVIFNSDVHIPEGCPTTLKEQGKSGVYDAFNNIAFTDISNTWNVLTDTYEPSWVQQNVRHEVRHGIVSLSDQNGRVKDPQHLRRVVDQEALRIQNPELARQLNYLDELHSHFFDAVEGNIEDKSSFRSFLSNFYSILGTGTHPEVASTTPEGKKSAEDLFLHLQGFLLLKRMSQEAVSIKRHIEELIFGAGALLATERSLRATADKTQALWQAALRDAELRKKFVEYMDTYKPASFGNTPVVSAELLDILLNNGRDASYDGDKPNVTFQEELGEQTAKTPVAVAGGADGGDGTSRPTIDGEAGRDPARDMTRFITDLYRGVTPEGLDISTRTVQKYRAILGLDQVNVSSDAKVLEIGAGNTAVTAQDFGLQQANLVRADLFPSQPEIEQANVLLLGYDTGEFHEVWAPFILKYLDAEIPHTVQVRFGEAVARSGLQVDNDELIRNLKIFLGIKALSEMLRVTDSSGRVRLASWDFDFARSGALATLFNNYEELPGLHYSTTDIPRDSNDPVGHSEKNLFIEKGAGYDQATFDAFVQVQFEKLIPTEVRTILAEQTAVDSTLPVSADRRQENPAPSGDRDEQQLFLTDNGEKASQKIGVKWREFYAAIPEAYSDQELEEALRNALAITPITDTSYSGSEIPSGAEYISDLAVLTDMFGNVRVQTQPHVVYFRTAEELKRALQMAYRFKGETLNEQLLTSVLSHENEHLAGLATPATVGDHAFGLELVRHNSNTLFDDFIATTFSGRKLNKLQAAAMIAHPQFLYFGAEERGDIVSLRRMGFKDISELTRRLRIYNSTHREQIPLPRSAEAAGGQDRDAYEQFFAKLAEHPFEQVFQGELVGMQATIAQLREQSSSRMEQIDALRRRRERILGDIAYINATLPDRREFIIGTNEFVLADSLREVESDLVHAIAGGVGERNRTTGNLWTDVMLGLARILDKQQRHQLANALYFDGNASILARRRVDRVLKTIQEINLEEDKRISGGQELSATSALENREAEAVFDRNDRLLTQNMGRLITAAEDPDISPKVRKARREEALRTAQTILEQGDETQIAEVLSVLDEHFQLWLQQDRSDNHIDHRLYGAILANLAHKGNAAQRTHALEQIYRGIIAKKSGRRTPIDRSILTAYFFYSRAHNQGGEARQILDEFLMPLYQSHGFSIEDYHRLTEAHLSSLDQGFHTEVQMNTVFEYDAIRTLDEAIPGASKTLYARRGIKTFSRLTDERLVSMYRNLDTPGRRFFVGLAEFDNGMMVLGKYALEKLLTSIEKTKGVDCVDIWELHSAVQETVGQTTPEYSFVESIKAASAQYGPLLGGFIIAHGEENSISFGPGWEGRMRRGDFTDELVSIFTASFIPNTSIFFSSCETANEGGIIEEASSKIPNLILLGGAGTQRNTISIYDFPGISLKNNSEGYYIFHIKKRKRDYIAGFRNGRKVL